MADFIAKLNPCTCGSQVGFELVDGSALYIKCPQCGRTTKSFCPVAKDRVINDRNLLTPVIEEWNGENPGKG